MIKLPRTHIEGAVYYVTSRGDNDEGIFKDEADYQSYLELVRKYKEQYGFKLFAYCLLPNHLHLLIELKEGLTISNIMHDLNANYTKYFNSRYARKGHLFQERYKIVLAEKKLYLLALSAYIHNNPLKLDMAQDLRDYTYSSYLYYTQARPEGYKSGVSMDKEVKELKEYLGKDKDYAGYLKGEAVSGIEGLGGDLNKEMILASGEFRKIIEAYVSNAPARETNKNLGKNRTNFILAGATVLLVLVCAVLYKYSLAQKDEFQKELKNKEQAINAKVAQEKKKIYQNLDEKYRADQVSYQAMAKRLEIEKRKARDLEAKTGH
jgi:REP element-mobilizing transposase RayT